MALMYQLLADAVKNQLLGPGSGALVIRCRGDGQRAGFVVRGYQVLHGIG
jgi:hypothetical protein